MISNDTTRKKPVLIFSVVLAIILLLAELSYPAITGKIAGKVTDTNGNGLPGANVILEGTQRGSASDADGNYFILSVPPGQYAVRAQMMGYQTVVQKNVLVQAGRTTTLNFSLNPTTIVGEEVIVTAERPVIEVDRTTTEHIMNAREIQQTPIIGNVRGLIEYLPGVTQDNGNRMVVRGGDAQDVTMYYDGIPMDSYKDINIFSVEEASITTGGIEAEYGNAQGGIINVITQEGGDKLHGTIEYGVSPPHQGHWGANYWDDAYHLDNNGVSRLRWNDPEWVNEVDSLTGRKVHEKIDYTDIWSQSIKIGLSGPLLFKHLYFSLGTQFSQGPAGPMHVNRYTLPYTHNNWKITYKPHPNFTIKSGGYYTWNKGYNSGSNVGTGVSFTTGGLGAQDIEGTIRNMRIGGAGRYTDDRNIFLPIDYATGGTHTSQDYMVYLSLTHLINSSTYYDLKLYRFDYTLQNQGVPDTVISNGRTDKDGWYYVEGGKGINYTNADNVKMGVKFDVSSQVTQHHLLKAGVDVQRYANWQTSITHFTSTRALRRIAGDYKTGEPIKPIKLAAYISDKMEFGGLVVNIGGRYDYYDWGSKFPVTYSLSKLSRPYNSFTRFRDMPDELWMTPKPLQAFSPRLGLSHPISERATIHFFYGHVYQLPSFWDMYHDEWYAKNANNPDKDLNKNGKVDDTELYNGLNDNSNRSHFGNPTLEYEKTTSFEMGVDWNFYQDYILTMTTYYKSAQNQARGGSVHQFWDPNRTSTAPYIHIINNTQYEDAKGFEFLLKKRFSNVFSFLLSFNLGWATEGWSGERVRTYVPDGSFVEKYYFEKYSSDTNGDGRVDELDSGAEVPEPLSESLLIKRKQAAEDYLQQLREQGAFIKPVENVEGLYYVSTHYSSVGHPRDNISRRTSFGLILYLDIPQQFGPEIFGWKPLSDIHANLTYRYHEGLPYQYTSIDGKALWRSAPLSSITNLRIEKSLRTGGLINTFFVTINNLFNNKQINNNASFANIVSLRDYVSYGLEGYSPLYDYQYDYRGKTDGGIYLYSPRSISFGLRLSF